MTKRFMIVANGTEMGFYEGVDANAAREAYAKDAGYSSFEQLASSQNIEEDEVIANEWKTQRHIMVTARSHDWDDVIAENPSQDGIVSQEDYECADEIVRQAIADKLGAEVNEQLKLPGTRAGEYRVMVIDYTDDSNGEDLVDFEMTVDEDEDLDDAA